jgi:hypothetical protein
MIGSVNYNMQFLFSCKLLTDGKIIPIYPKLGFINIPASEATDY